MTTKTVHVAIYDTLADWEVGYAMAGINNPAWQAEPGRYTVKTVGLTREPVRTVGGMTLVPDLTLDELDPAESAMLILPGADTWATGDNAGFAKKARELLDTGLPVAAICAGTAGLAAEGLLDDRAHTSNAAEFLAATGYAGAQHYRNEMAVTDGNVVTASAFAPVDFAREIFALLGVYTPEVLGSWYKLFGENDPSGYFELESA